MLDSPGIYLILCRPTGEKYIGGTKRPMRLRFTAHRTQLRSGRCTIPKLQAAYDLHGPDAFEYIPLKNFPEDQIADREREALEFLKPELNTSHVTGKSGYRRWPHITVDGVSLSVNEVARKYGISSRMLRFRIEKGLTGDALVAPAHKAPRKPYTRRK